MSPAPLVFSTPTRDQALMDRQNQDGDILRRGAPRQCAVYLCLRHKCRPRDILGFIFMGGGV
jgi:hypothetical protein